MFYGRMYFTGNVNICFTPDVNIYFVDTVITPGLWNKSQELMG